MRSILSVTGIAVVALLILGLIGAGGYMVFRGGKPLVERWIESRKKVNPVTKQQETPPPIINVFPPPPEIPPETKNLLEARAGYRTKLRVPIRNDKGTPPPPAPPGAKLIDYGKGVRRSAFVSIPEDPSKKHPAVVWAHSGFRGISNETWKVTQPFRENGILVMCPSFRGEHENPGNFEMFYGEVDDLLQAVEYMRSLAYVDPKRIYVVGDRGGATISLLMASTGTDKVRAFFCFNATPDIEHYVRRNPADPIIPFRIDLPDEARFRSAIRFTPFIRQPTFLFNPQVRQEQSQQALLMQEQARKSQIPLRAYIIPRASSDQIPDRMPPLIAMKIQQDLKPTCDITFKDSEVSDLFVE